MAELPGYLLFLALSFVGGTAPAIGVWFILRRPCKACRATERERAELRRMLAKYRWFDARMGQIRENLIRLPFPLEAAVEDVIRAIGEVTR